MPRPHLGQPPGGARVLDDEADSGRAGPAIRAWSPPSGRGPRPSQEDKTARFGQCVMAWRWTQSCPRTRRHPPGARSIIAQMLDELCVRRAGRLMRRAHRCRVARPWSPRPAVSGRVCAHAFRITRNLTGSCAGARIAPRFAAGSRRASSEGGDYEKVSRRGCGRAWRRCSART